MFCKKVLIGVVIAVSGRVATAKTLKIVKAGKWEPEIGKPVMFKVNYKDYSAGEWSYKLKRPFKDRGTIHVGDTGIVITGPHPRQMGYPLPTWKVRVTSGDGEGREEYFSLEHLENPEK